MSPESCVLPLSVDKKRQERMLLAPAFFDVVAKSWRGGAPVESVWLYLLSLCVLKVCVRSACSDVDRPQQPDPHLRGLLQQL